MAKNIYINNISKFYKLLSFALTFFIIILFILIPFTIFKDKSFDLIAGGDFRSPFPYVSAYEKYLFSWGGLHGQGAFNTAAPSFLYYFAQSILYRVFGGYTLHAWVSLYFITVYTSFLIALKRFFGDNINGLHKIVLSFLYTFNPFILTVFSFSWGYNHHMLFYLFVPLLFSQYYVLLRKENLMDNFREILVYLCTIGVAFVSFNNIAFLLVLILLQSLFFLIYSYCYNKFNLLRFAILMSLLIVILLPYLISFYMGNSFLYHKTYQNEVFGGSIKHLFKTPNRLLDIFSLSRKGWGVTSVIIGVMYFFSLILSFFKARVGKLNVTLITLFIMIVFLNLRQNPPFASLSSIFYSIPGSSLLKSADKLLIVLPFLYFITMSSVLLKVNRHVRVFVTVSLLISSFFVIVSIFDGSVSSYLSGVEKRTASSFVNIPDEYKSLDINNYPEISTSIVSLPYSVVNSLNWSNYPKWNFIGGDVLSLLFNRNYISANTADHPYLETIMTYKGFVENNNCCDRGEIMDSFQKFGAEFILWHKDIDIDRFNQNLNFYNSLRGLVDDGLVYQIEENDYFELYRLEDREIYPIVHLDNAEVIFKKVKPTKYVLYIEGLNAGDRVIFKQSYSPEWKVFALSQDTLRCEGFYKYSVINSTECLSGSKEFLFNGIEYLFKKPLKLDHSLIDEYSNMWVISAESIEEIKRLNDYSYNEDGSINVSLSIFYRPQSYLILQYYIIVVVVLITGLYHLSIFFRKKDAF